LTHFTRRAQFLEVPYSTKCIKNQFGCPPIVIYLPHLNAHQKRTMAAAKVSNANINFEKIAAKLKDAVVFNSDLKILNDFFIDNAL
jgi:hypothetical protein